MIRGLLFDYGGTIDTNGIHWAVVLKQYYNSNGLDIPSEIFSKAYKFGERSLAIKPLVKPDHTFLQVLNLKIEQQFNFLEKNHYKMDFSYVEKIASDCNDFALDNVNSAIPMLLELKKRYPLVMVSNFYGNLNSVLENFGVRNLFEDIIESALVGFRKPEPMIYSLGIKALRCKANECLVIGDSFTKDIIPAKQLGCKTVWLNKIGWEDDAGNLECGDIKSDYVIDDLINLTRLLETNS